MRLKIGIPVGLQHEVDEGPWIEEARVRFSSIWSIAGVLGIERNSDLLPHLGTHFKVFRDLLEIPEQLRRGGRSVKTGIDANGPEERPAFIEILAKFAEAFSCKGGGSVFSAIDLSLPAFIRPG